MPKNKGKAVKTSVIESVIDKDCDLDFQLEISLQWRIMGMW